MRTTGKAAFGRVRPRHEALGSRLLPCASLPALEQAGGRRGETSGARDGLTIRPKALETEECWPLRTFRT